MDLQIDRRISPALLARIDSPVRPHMFRPLLAGLLLFWLIDIAAVIISLAAGTAASLDDLLVPLALALAAIAAFLALRTVGPASPVRRSLRFFLALFCLDSLGTALFGLVLIGAPPQLEGLALLCVIPAYPLGFLGLVTFPRVAPLSRSRFVIDLLMILTGGLMVITHFVILPFLDHLVGQASPEIWIEALVFPVADLIILAGIASIIASHPSVGGRSVIGTITTAFLFFLVGDGLTAAAAVGTIPAELGRLAGPAMIGAALCAIWVAHQVASSPAALVDRPVRFASLGRLIPVIVVGAGFVALLLTALTEGAGELLLAGGAALLVGVVAIGRSLEACFGESAQRQLTNSALVRAQAQAQRDRLDTLTGLGNRLALTEWVEAASRSGPVTVAVIGLTSLRDVNETLGFGAGDKLLVAVAAALRLSVPADDLLVRLSGDVFAIASSGEPKVASQAVREILGRLTEPFEIGDRQIGLIINAGQASMDSGLDLDSGAVIRWAEAARAAARRSHRILIVDEREEDLGTDVPHSASVRLPELRAAIASGGLTLYYQPYRDRSSARFSHAEALVRWIHPTEGLLPPSAFLPLAEIGGLMGELDRWVLSEACRQARAWRDAGHPIRISVNASAASIHDPEYAWVVMRTLARHGLPGSAIEIEITEESAFEGSDDRLPTLATELRALGVDLAIDDFGTGASSLRRLRDMPVETLKIDRSFIATSLSNPRDAAITESIIGLAVRLGLKTVAEGVEDAETLAYLDKLGVDYIQGYFVCRPVTAAALFEMLSAETIP